MRKTTTDAAEIAAILQSYINVCGIAQYIEPTAADFDVIEKIKCDLRICNLLSKRENSEYTDRGYIVSDAKYYELRLPDRERVLIFCDFPKHTKNRKSAECLWDWCREYAAAGHIVAVKHFAAPTGFIEIWHDAENAEKLFILGGLKNAENSRS